MIKVNGPMNIQYKGSLGEIIAEIIMLLRELHQEGHIDEKDLDFIKRNVLISDEEMRKSMREDLLKEIDDLLEILEKAKRSKDGKSDD